MNEPTMEELQEEVRALKNLIGHYKFLLLYKDQTINELRSNLYEKDMQEKIDRIKNLPEPDLENVSEYTRTDYFKGRK